MSTRTEKFEAFKEVWRNKGYKKAVKELESYRKYLEKHRDSFFQQCHPDDLSDGMRVAALKDVVREFEEAQQQ